MKEDSVNRLIIGLNQVLTRTVYLLYPALIAYLLILWLSSGESLILRGLLVPGISFVLVSIFRRIYNAPRPYEAADAKAPIIKKDSLGKSFPSRHIFSIFIIAITYLWVAWSMFESELATWPESWRFIPGLIVALGVLTFLVGVVLAFVRVLGGVHFPRDVIAGAIIAIFCGALGFWLI